MTVETLVTGEPATVVTELPVEANLRVLVDVNTVCWLIVDVGVGILRHEQACDICCPGSGFTQLGVGTGVAF